MYKFLCRVLCIAFISFLTACGGGANKQATSVSGVTFAFGKGALVSAKSAKTVRSALASTVAPAPKYVLVSATDSNGTPVLNSFKAEIYALNNSYITAPIPLNQGNYKLTSFLVLDSNDNVVYLVPTQAATADIQALVRTLLPMTFQINGSQPNAVSVDVLAPDSSPADFGYPTFTFNPVNYVSFLSEVKAQGVDVVANLTVNGVVYNHPVGISRLRVAQAANYTLVFSKPGYISQTIQLSASDIANYETSSLVVSLVPVPTTAVVTFNTNGGTSIDPITVAIGYDLTGSTLPPPPTKPGYLFGGWYLDPQLTIPLPDDYVVTGDVIIYAKWIYNAAQYLAWTGVESIRIDGVMRTSPYQLPQGVTTMTVVISGASGGNGIMPGVPGQETTIPGLPGEQRTFTGVPIIAGTYSITLGAVGGDGQLSTVHNGRYDGPSSGAGGGGASSLKIAGSYVAGAAGGAGGGDFQGFSPDSAPVDMPGGVGGSGDGSGGNGEDSDGYLGIDGGGGNGGVVNTGGAAVGGTVTGSTAGAGTIEIRILTQ